jgi:circadian clock protein KaiC
MSTSRNDAQPSGDIDTGTVVFNPTGVPGLDRALGGGLPRGALTLVVGPPGSGKTTLAVQTAFGAAKDGRRVLILTALSEPTVKLVSHLRTLRFFDQQLVGGAVQIFNLGQFLKSGLDATADELVAAARQQRADLVVIDGFRGIRGAASLPHESRQFLYDIGGRLSTLGATVIVTSEPDLRDSTLYSEATTADVIIGLVFHLVGVRQRRGLEVAKVRGLSPYPGLHGFAIDETGVTIYPRLEAEIASAEESETGNDEALHAIATRDAAESPRAGFDLPELDVMLQGGLTRGTRALLVGRIGTGKSLLGLNFALAGIRRGESALIVGFRESPGELVRKVEPFAFGAEFRAALSSGSLTLLRLAPVELDPDRLTARILDLLDRTGAQRLVVDSVSEVERAVTEQDPGRLSGYLAALVEALRSRNVTSLFIKESHQTWPGNIDFADDPLAVLAENVLLTRQVEQRTRQYRILSVLKMSFSAYDPSLREFVITAPDGIRVLAMREADYVVLTEVAEEDAREGRELREHEH